MKNTLSRIEDKFDKKFETRAKFIHTCKPDENGMAICGCSTYETYIKTSPNNIKSFYRQQILALLDDVEGELPKEERSCKNCSELTFDVNCPYCGCGIFKVKNRFIRLSDVKTILDNYKKEIQK